jgi:hypothetical protein
MFAITVRRLFLCIALGFLLVGCATKTGTYIDGVSMGRLYSKTVSLFYSGEVRSFESVAVLSLDTALIVKSVKDSAGNPVSSVLEKSQNGLYSTGRRQWHFLPGTYTFVVGYNFSDGTTRSWSTQDLEQTVALEKGQVKHLNLFFGGRSWNMTVTDGSAAIAALKEDFDFVMKAKQ